MNATPPHEAKNRYLKDKSTDVTDSTLSNYETTLNVFCEWLTDEAGVDTLNTLTSDEIHKFKEHRIEQVKTITLNRHDLHQGLHPLLRAHQSRPRRDARVGPGTEHKDGLDDDLRGLIEWLRDYADGLNGKMSEVKLGAS
jgi:hypothetical protein